MRAMNYCLFIFVLSSFEPNVVNICIFLQILVLRWRKSRNKKRLSPQLSTTSVENPVSQIVSEKPTPHQNDSEVREF